VETLLVVHFFQSAHIAFKRCFTVLSTLSQQLFSGRLEIPSNGHPMSMCAETRGASRRENQKRLHFRSVILMKLHCGIEEGKGLVERMHVCGRAGHL
jgi:hypothetical protein